MIKYKIFQVIMAVSVVMLIISTAIVLMFAVRNVPQEKYSSIGEEEPSVTMVDGSVQKLTDFEAWLAYSVISDGFDSGNKAGFQNGEIALSEDNVNKLEILNGIKTQAGNGMFFSIVVLVICFLVVKKRRLYECIVWGGTAGLIIGAAGIIMMMLSGNGVLFGIKKMVFNNDYTIFFSGEDAFAQIIPYGTALKMFAMYAGTILAGFLVTILIRLVCLKKSKPHKF